MKKYGRTYHLPMSPGVMSDDKVMRDLSRLESAAEVVFTEKMDGKNTTIHAGGCHARSPDSVYHMSRDWVKASAASISPQLQPSERIVGEYLYARHSVGYRSLPSYFPGFAWINEGRVACRDASVARFEGFVVRDAAAYSEAEMGRHMGKYVRAGHVQSEVHWRQAEIVKNGLA